MTLFLQLTPFRVSCHDNQKSFKTTTTTTTTKPVPIKYTVVVVVVVVVAHVECHAIHVYEHMKKCMEQKVSY